MHTRNLVLWAAGLLSLIAASVPTHAEIVKKISVEGIYDNNAFKSSGGASDAISQTSFYLARRDTSAKTGVDYFYNADVALFVRSNQRHFTAHHVGLSYLRQFGQDGHLFSAGWNFGGRWDRTVYNYYDNLDGSFYTSFKLNLPSRVFLRMSYRMNARKYLHLDASSFREHLASLTYNVSMPTRTALKADLSYGYKGYTKTQTVAIEAPEVTRHAARRERHGMRRGPFGTPAQLLGESYNQVMIPIQSGAPDKSQVIFSLRASQSLSPSTGVNIQYLTRINPLTTGRYQSGLGTGYAENDDLFDDRYDYQGHEVSGGLSQLLPLGSKLTIEAGYLIKNYINKPALDLNGVSTGLDRRDRKRYLSAGIEMPVGMAYDLNLWYIHGTNGSNDPFYAYRNNHAFSFGISREF